MPVVQIRPRIHSDLEWCVTALRKVHEAVGYPVNWPTDPARWLTPSTALGAWVATIQDKLAGHVVLTADSSGRASVERLFVDPDQTGAGIGHRLLDHCVNAAVPRRLHLSLEVADNCHAAIALYRRAGWRETGREPVSWGGELSTTVVHFEAPIVRGSPSGER